MIITTKERKNSMMFKYVYVIDKKYKIQGNICTIIYQSYFKFYFKFICF